MSLLHAKQDEGIMAFPAGKMGKQCLKSVEKYIRHGKNLVGEFGVRIFVVINEMTVICKAANGVSFDAPSVFLRKLFGSASGRLRVFYGYDP